MNFIHRVHQTVPLAAGQKAPSQPSLLTKCCIKFKQVRLLDNTNGFNVPVLTTQTVKRKIQTFLNAKVTQREDLHKASKFEKIGMGGYESINEHSYVLLVDVSKDNQKRMDEMKRDGGNLDDDKIEREWYQLMVITSIQVSQSEITEMLSKAMSELTHSFYGRF